MQQNLFKCIGTFASSRSSKLSPHPLMALDGAVHSMSSPTDLTSCLLSLSVAHTVSTHRMMIVAKNKHSDGDIGKKSCSTFFHHKTDKRNYSSSIDRMLSLIRLLYGNRHWWYHKCVYAVVNSPVSTTHNIKKKKKRGEHSIHIVIMNSTRHFHVAKQAIPNGRERSRAADRNSGRIIYISARTFDTPNMYHLFRTPIYLIS